MVSKRNCMNIALYASIVIYITGVAVILFSSTKMSIKYINYFKEDGTTINIMNIWKEELRLKQSHVEDNKHLVAKAKDALNDMTVWSNQNDIENRLRSDYHYTNDVFTPEFIRGTNEWMSHKDIVKMEQNEANKIKVNMQNVMLRLNNKKLNSAILKFDVDLKRRYGDDMELNIEETLKRMKLTQQVVLNEKQIQINTDWMFNHKGLRGNVKS